VRALARVTGSDSVQELDRKSVRALDRETGSESVQE
jgi:hypothetical protein